MRNARGAQSNRRCGIANMDKLTAPLKIGVEEWSQARGYTTDGIAPAGNSYLPPLVAFYDLQEKTSVQFYAHPKTTGGQHDVA